MALVDHRFRKLYALLFTVFVLFGTSITVVGATLPRILGSFGWSYVGAGIVLAAGSIGSFLATSFAGRLVERLGPRFVVLLGLGLDALGLALFALLPSVPANAALYLAVGLGQGFLEVAVNWSVLRMSGPGEGRAMSLMHGAFSVGAMAGPFLVGLLGPSGLPWTLVYRILALVIALLGLAVLTEPFSVLAVPQSGHKAAGRSARGERGAAFYLGFLALFLYVGTEIGVSNWAAEYFVRIFRRDGAAAFMVSLFWGGLLAGRFGIPLLLPRARQDRLLLVLALAFSVSVGLLFAAGLAGPAAFPLGVLAIAAAGLGASCIYPAAVTLVGSAYREAPGAAIGFASTGGSVGAFVFPFIMSAIANRAGLVTGFGFYAFSAILTATLASALAAAARARIARTGKGSRADGATGP